jgi:serine protease
MKKLAAVSRLTFLGLLFSLGLIAAAPRAQAQYSYYALNPCRVVDTRNPNGVNGGPILTAGQRNFTVRGVCGVPTTAKAVTLNVAVTGATSSAYLTLFPSGQAVPNTATINFTTSDPALSNGAIVGLSTNAQDLAVYNASTSVHLIIDVTGYFQ